MSSGGIIGGMKGIERKTRGGREIEGEERKKRASDVKMRKSGKEGGERREGEYVSKQIEKEEFTMFPSLSSL